MDKERYTPKAVQDFCSAINSKLQICLLIVNSGLPTMFCFDDLFQNQFLIIQSQFFLEICTLSLAKVFDIFIRQCYFSKENWNFDCLSNCLNFIILINQQNLRINLIYYQKGQATLAQIIIITFAFYVEYFLTNPLTQKQPSSMHTHEIAHQQELSYFTRIYQQSDLLLVRTEQQYGSNKFLSEIEVQSIQGIALEIIRPACLFNLVFYYISQRDQQQYRFNPVFYSQSKKQKLKFQSISLIYCQIIQSFVILLKEQLNYSAFAGNQRLVSLRRQHVLHERQQSDCLSQIRAVFNILPQVFLQNLQVFI